MRCWLGDERHTVYLRLHDLSRGGLSVRAPVPFSPDDDLEVGLELPGGTCLRARGQVVWVNDPEPDSDGPSAQVDGPRMGARFLEFLEGEEELSLLLGHA